MNVGMIKNCPNIPLFSQLLCVHRSPPMYGAGNNTGQPRYAEKWADVPESYQEQINNYWIKSDMEKVQFYIL